METIQIAATYNLLFNAALMVEQVFSPAVEVFYKKITAEYERVKGVEQDS